MTSCIGIQNGLNKKYWKENVLHQHLAEVVYAQGKTSNQLFMDRLGLLRVFIANTSICFKTKFINRGDSLFVCFLLEHVDSHQPDIVSIFLHVKKKLKEFLFDQNVPRNESSPRCWQPYIVATDYENVMRYKHKGGNTHRPQIVWYLEISFIILVSGFPYKSCVGLTGSSDGSWVLWVQPGENLNVTSNQKETGW